MTKKMPKSPRMRDRYYRPTAGEWIQPILRGYRLACCDCGLVHTMAFRVKDGKPQFAVWRNNRATAAMRRERKIKVRNAKS